MFVVYATGQYITGVNDAGSRCDTVTFQQASKALTFITAAPPPPFPNPIVSAYLLAELSDAPLLCTCVIMAVC